MAAIPAKRCLCSSGRLETKQMAPTDVPVSYIDAALSFTNHLAHDVAPTQCEALTKAKIDKASYRCQGRGPCRYPQNPHGMLITFDLDTEQTLRFRIECLLHVSVIPHNAGGAIGGRNLNVNATITSAEQLTMYAPYETCTPSGALAKYCKCDKGKQPV